MNDQRGPGDNRPGPNRPVMAARPGDMREIMQSIRAYATKHASEPWATEVLRPDGSGEYQSRATDQGASGRQMTLIEAARVVA